MRRATAELRDPGERQREDGGAGAERGGVLRQTAESGTEGPHSQTADGRGHGGGGDREQTRLLRAADASLQD